MSFAAKLVQAIVDGHVKRYRNGDNLALLEAVQFSLGNSATLPPDIIRAYASAMTAYHLGEAKTLDEAFGVQRPKHWRAQSQKDAHRAGEVFSRVNRFREQGMAIDKAIGEVADQMGWNETKVETFYYCYAHRYGGDRWRPSSRKLRKTSGKS
ncbi:MAG: hypothetical protein ACLFTD_10635 [Halochromatium sp.]